MTGGGGRSRRVGWMVAAAAAAAPAGLAAQQDSVPADSLRAPVVLDEVVVTAAGYEQRRASAPASITVMTRAELALQRNNGLAEVLASVEGVDVGDDVGKTGGRNISLRGMPSDYTLILIDGRRQNAAGNVTPNNFGDTGSGFLPPASAIDRIEVIRGPMSTLYGSDAMGGVINIITRRAGRRWSGSFSSGATLQQEPGFGTTYDGNAWLTGPVVDDLLSVSLRGSVMHREASELAPTGEVGEGVAISRRGPSPVEGDVYTVGARLSFTPSSAHDVTLEWDRARQAYDNAQGQLGTLDRPDASPPSFRGYGPELRFHRDQAALAHTWRFGAGMLQSSLMRNTTETVGRTLPTGTPGGPPGSGAPDKTPGAPRRLEATNDVLDTRLVRLAGPHTLSVGAQYWDARMVDGVALQPFEHTQWSLFVEDEWRLGRAVALTLGLRRDDHSTFGAHVSPRAYLVWSAAPAWTLKGGVSQGFKTPRLEQLVDGIIGFGAQGTMALVGTPTLTPETSTTTEVGAFFTGAGGTTASVTLFNNRFTDKITSGTPVPNCTFAGAPDRPGCLNYGDFPAQEFFRQSVNVDEAVTRGVEASAAVRLTGVWSASGNYTRTWSEQRSGENRGMPLTSTPDHMLNGALRAQWTDRLGGWLRGEYRSARPRRTTVAADPAYDALGDFRAYTLFHLGGAYRLGRGVSVSATVYNLLNRDFLRYGAYQGEPTAENPTGTLYTSLYNVHQEGRRLWISTSFEF